MKRRFEWLAKLINDNQYTLGAEVGVATGITTDYLLNHCPTLKKLITVDMWYPVDSPKWNRPDMEQVFRGLFGENDRVRIIKSISWEGAKFVTPQSLDFVFIDASHEFTLVLKDVKSWIKTLKIDGILCGHDYHNIGVRTMLDYVFEDKYKLAGVDNCWYVEMKDINNYFLHQLTKK